MKRKKKYFLFFKNYGGINPGVIVDIILCIISVTVEVIISAYLQRKKIKSKPIIMVNLPL